MARLAQALDGDLKAMLEMANCFPRIILDRISAQAGALALAIDGLVNLDQSQRSNLFSLIARFPAN